MTLYIIGLGLGTEKDISVKGLEIIRRCDRICLENYTSVLQCSVQDLEQFYGKKIILADRNITELDTEKIVAEARKKNVAFLVVGDPFSATTHIELFKIARQDGIPVEVIHNASILTAIGMTGLQLYKFGRVTSIPFLEDVPELEAPYQVLRENFYLGAHTLFLLDLKPEKNKFMSVNEALKILAVIEARKKEGIITPRMLVIGCARLGTENYMIKAGPLVEISQHDFGPPPHGVVIPAKKLHFAEEEMVRGWR